MIIELNTKLGEIPKINSNQILFLSLVLDRHQKKDQNVQKLLSLISEDEILDLSNQKLITSIERGNSTVYEPSDKLKKLLEPPKAYFDLFYDMYPKYVLRPDGTKGYLRTNVNKCRNMYNSVVGHSDAMAEHINDCLRFEIDRKMAVGKIGYMKTMWRWLIERCWEASEEEMQDEQIKQTSSYGTEVI